MLAARLKKMEIEAERAPRQFSCLRGGGGEELSSGPMGDVDGVNIVDQIHDRLGLQEVGEPAAKLGGEIELSVGKGPGPAEAGHDGAGVTARAVLDLPGDDGTLTVIDVPAPFQYDHIQLRLPLTKLVGGVYAGGAGADDGNVICHENAPLR